MVILIKLIAAHLIGDFLFQSDGMCKKKFNRKLSTQIQALSLHSLIQAALTYIFIGEWHNWIPPVIIFFSHFLIDYIKTRLQKTGFVSLLIDQAAHYVVLTTLWWLIFVNNKNAACYSTDYLLSQSIWIVLTSYILVLAPTSIFIKSFIEHEGWMPDNAASQGLPNAGKWIGYLERILILTFIFTGNIEGVGFLLAAKSIFRFGELNRAKDIRMTEYVLIGTFASFAIAILTGFAAKWLISFNYETL